MMWKFSLLPFHVTHMWTSCISNLGTLPPVWDIIPGKCPSWQMRGNKPLNLEKLTLVKQCFKRKIVIKRGKSKKLINRNLKKGRPEWRGLMPYDYSRAQHKEDRLLFFPGKDSADEKPWILCLLEPSQLPFPSYKVFSFPCTLLWLQIPNYKFMLILNKPIFARKTSEVCFFQVNSMTD